MFKTIFFPLQNFIISHERLNIEIPSCGWANFSTAGQHKPGKMQRSRKAMADVHRWKKLSMASYCKHSNRPTIPRHIYASSCSMWSNWYVWNNAWQRRKQKSNKLWSWNSISCCLPQRTYEYCIDTTKKIWWAKNWLQR